MKTVKLHETLESLTFKACAELIAQIQRQELIGSSIQFFENYRMTHKAVIKLVDAVNETITVERALTARSDIDRDLVPTMKGATVSWTIV